MYWITLSMKCEGKTMTKHGLQILVTGGRPLEHTALMENLRAEGAMVSEATDFAAILQVSQNNKLDVLVLIEPLPYRGRLRQIVALLRAQNATTKLVILSTNDVPERVQVTLKAGADWTRHSSSNPRATLRAAGYHYTPPPFAGIRNTHFTRPQTYQPSLCGRKTFRDHAIIRDDDNNDIYQTQEYTGWIPPGEPNPEIHRSGPWPYLEWPAYVAWWHQYTDD